MRLLLWYLGFCYFVLPLLLAIFTGGASLAIYVLPFALIVGQPYWSVAFSCWLAPALVLWAIHLFLRFTFQYQWRKQQLIRRF